MTIVVIYCDEQFQMSYETKDLIEQSESVEVLSISMQAKLSKVFTELSIGEACDHKFCGMSIKQEKQPRKKTVVHNFRTIANIGFMKRLSRNIFKCLLTDCNFTTHHKNAFEGHLGRHLNDGGLRKSVSVCEWCKKQIKATNLLGEFAHLMEHHVRPADRTKLEEKVDTKICASVAFSSSLSATQNVNELCAIATAMHENVRNADLMKFDAENADAEKNFANKPKEFKNDKLSHLKLEATNLLNSSVAAPVLPISASSQLAISGENHMELENAANSPTTEAVANNDNKILNSLEPDESAENRENLKTSVTAKVRESTNPPSVDLVLEETQSESTGILNQVSFEVSVSFANRMEEQNESENKQTKKYSSEHDSKRPLLSSLCDSLTVKPEQRNKKPEIELKLGDKSRTATSDTLFVAQSEEVSPSKEKMNSPTRDTMERWNDGYDGTFFVKSIFSMSENATLADIFADSSIKIAPDDNKTFEQVSFNGNLKRKSSEFSDDLISPKRNCSPFATAKASTLSDMLAVNSTVIDDSLNRGNPENNEPKTRETSDDVLELRDCNALVIDAEDKETEEGAWEILDSWEEKPVEPELTTESKVTIKREIIKLSDDMLDEKKPYNANELMPWVKNKKRKNFKNRKIYDSMMDTASLANLFKCMEANCKFSTSILSKFEFHIQKHHNNNQAFPGTTKFQGMCAYCPFGHPVAFSLAAHIERIHGCSPFQCPKCFYRCDEAETCYEHMREHHKGNNAAIIECPVQRRSQVSILRRINWMRQLNVQPIQCIGELNIFSDFEIF